MKNKLIFIIGGVLLVAMFMFVRELGGNFFNLLNPSSTEFQFVFIVFVAPAAAIYFIISKFLLGRSKSWFGSESVDNPTYKITLKSYGDKLNITGEANKEHIGLVVGILIFIGYYFSPLSMFFWHPSLKFLIHIFLAPFYIIPESWFVINSDFMVIPNPFTIGFSLFVSAAVIYFLPIFFIYLANRFKFRSKLLFSVSVIFVVALAGGIGEQEICEYRFSSLYSKDGERYLKDTGVVYFSLDRNHGIAYFLPLEIRNFIGDAGLDAMYKFVGIDLLDSKTRNRIAGTKNGEEINKTCRLRSYGQINSDNTVPLTESSLFGGYASVLWDRINPVFCESSQLVSHSREDCLLSLKNGRPSLNKKSFAPKDAENKVFSSRLVSFEYKHPYSVFKRVDLPENVMVSIFGPMDTERSFINITAFKIDVSDQVQLGIAQTYEARKAGDEEWNGHIKNVQLVKVGDYDFYKWQEESGNGSVTNYETLASNGIDLSISINYPEHENYIEDIEKIIKTIKVQSE